MKLNLGSGTQRSPGYVNADLYGGDLRADATALPFKSDSFEDVQASQVLEHVLRLNLAMREIWRVLVPGGTLHADVPYGLQGLFNPYHVHAFSKKTFLWFCVDPAGDPAHDPPTYLEFGRRFILVDQKTKLAQPPLLWHLEHHTPRLGAFARRFLSAFQDRVELPFGRRVLYATLRKEVA